MTPEEAAACVDALGEAFAAADSAAVLAAFTSSGELMYVGSEPGECAVGPEGLRALLHELFARDERYLWRCESVRLAASPRDVAVLAEARLFVLPHAGPAPEPVPYRVSGILTREHDGWRWRFCQGAEPSPG